jgi:signal transduction histidine kinase
MTGRIVGAVLALIIGLLAVVAVPLGLITAAHDRTGFREQAVSSAQSLAGIAEERISDETRDPGLRRALGDLATAGDRAAIYDRAGRRIAGTGSWTLPSGRVPPRLPRTGSSAYLADGRLVVLVPVIPDSGLGTVGTVALSRSTAPVDHDITTLWTLIAAVAAAGLLVAAGVAVAIARWVGRPLIVLDGAVRRLGGGDLDTRAPVSAGPAEVRRLAATFNAMAARLQALIHGHRSMMADVSHQVRTPLAALRLRLDLLAQDADAQTAAELAGAQDEIARLARLVNGLLAVARAESGTAPPVRVSLDAIARDRAAAWGPAADDRGVALAVTAPAPVPAQAREGHLEQALDNLIANALDALSPGGTIRIAAEVTAASGQATITVADDGPGMSAEQQRLAFRRFGSGKPGGTGLGLAIVDRLVEASGGTVSLSDSPGGGLTVRIGLPGPRVRPAGTRRPGALAPGRGIRKF